MDIEIRIGRDITDYGGPIYNVPPNFKRVSRKHAVIYWNDGVVTIEDTESSNGTFVNGRQVARTRLNETDTVWLGGNGDNDECYRLDLKQVYDACRKIEHDKRTDYTKEFDDMKQAYREYQLEIGKIQGRPQLWMNIISAIPAVAGGVFFFVFKDMTLRIAVISIGAALAAVVRPLFGQMNNTPAKSDALTAIQLKYQPLYRCPKCGQEIPLSTHWMKLAAGGKCPNPKCNAQFVIKSDSAPVQ